MSTEERLKESAAYIYDLAQICSPSVRSRLQFYAETLRDLAGSFPELRAAAHADKVTIEAARQQNQQLRQAVKDLTASSEKLRAVNLKAVQKNLSQGKAIANLEKAVESYYQDTINLKRQIQELQKPSHQFADLFGPSPLVSLFPTVAKLIKAEDELKAALAANQQLEREKTDQYRQAKELRAELQTVSNQRNYYRQADENKQHELDSLKANRGFTQQDGERLRTALISVAEIIEGAPVDTVIIRPCEAQQMPAGYQPDGRPSA